MLDRIKFPFMNMQQLNLDWLLDHVANMPEIVRVPALAGDQLSDVSDMVDLKALEIPKGVCFMKAGIQDDPLDRQAVCWIFKVDNDNILLFVMGFSSDIGFYGLTKNAGVWS